MESQLLVWPLLEVTQMRVTQVVEDTVQTWSTMTVIPRVEDTVQTIGIHPMLWKTNVLRLLHVLRFVMENLCRNTMTMTCRAIRKTLMFEVKGSGRFEAIMEIGVLVWQFLNTIQIMSSTKIKMIHMVTRRRFVILKYMRK